MIITRGMGEYNMLVTQGYGYEHVIPGAGYADEGPTIVGAFVQTIGRIVKVKHPVLGMLMLLLFGRR